MLFVIELHSVNKGLHRWLGSGEVVLNQQTFAVKFHTCANKVKEACGKIEACGQMGGSIL